MTNINLWPYYKYAGPLQALATAQGKERMPPTVDGKGWHTSRANQWQTGFLLWIDGYTNALRSGCPAVRDGAAFADDYITGNSWFGNKVDITQELLKELNPHT